MLYEYKRKDLMEMTREYTDDEISGRSVLSKFRHLKDWVVAQFADVDHIVDDVADDVDALDTRVTRLEEKEDAGIRSISLSPFTETIGNVGYIGVEETHTNPSGGTGSSNVILLSSDPESDRDDCGLTAEAIQTLVAGAGGGSDITEVALGRRSYAEGFTDRDSDYLQLNRLTKTPMYMDAANDGYYGWPICSIDEHALVFDIPPILKVKGNYLATYAKQGSSVKPRIWSRPYTWFSTACRTAWGLIEGKTYLVLEMQLEPNLSPSYSDIFGSNSLPYGPIIECKDFTLGRVIHRSPVFNNINNGASGTSLTFDASGNRFLFTLQDQRGNPMFVSAFALDDNSMLVQCAADVATDGLGSFNMSQFTPLSGTFTDGNQYTVYYTILTLQ